MNQKTVDNHKKTYIEWLRVISMAAVVISHIGSTAHSDFPDSYFHSWGGFLFQSIVYLSHFAVPCFFMISGALLLNPEKEMPVAKILKRYVLRYCWILLIFAWGYAYLELLFQSKKFVPADLFTSFCNMLQGKSWAHMWYLYTLVGLMLILPILRAAVRACSKTELHYLLIVLLIFTSILPVILKTTGFSFGIVFPVASVYPLYMILGYLLDNETIKPRGKTYIYEIICVILLVLCAYFHIMQNVALNFGVYNSPIIVVYSVLIFHRVKAWNPKENKTVSFLGSVSFGVYLTHMIWINLAFKLFKLNPLAPTPITGMLMAIVTFILSVILTFILKKIPGFRKLL